MKNLPRQQRILFFAGILLLNAALWSKYFLHAPGIEFIEGFFISLGIVFTVAAVFKLVKLRHAAANSRL